MFKKNQTPAKCTEKIKEKIPLHFLSQLPQLELSGNRQLIIEGSKGILKYESDLIRINTKGLIISFFGRNLNVRCIAPESTIVEGFITKIEFTP